MPGSHTQLNTASSHHSTHAIASENAYLAVLLHFIQLRSASKKHVLYLFKHALLYIQYSALTWQAEGNANTVVVSNTMVSTTHDVKGDKITVGHVWLSWEQALLEGRGNLKKKRKKTAN